MLLCRSENDGGLGLHLRESVLIGYQDTLLSAPQIGGDNLWLKNQRLLLIGLRLAFLALLYGDQRGVVARLDQASGPVSSMNFQDLLTLYMILVRNYLIGTSLRILT